MAIIGGRNQKQVKINWQFLLQAARQKLNKHYVAVNVQNQTLSNA